MKHTIELHPFSVPNFVRQIVAPGKREDGWREAPAIPLYELSEETLEALCADFRRAVFEKAGRTTPSSESTLPASQSPHPPPEKPPAKPQP